MTDSIATAESKANPKIRRYLKAGIYAPLPTFFQPGSEDLDIAPFATQVVRLGTAGVTPVVSGSMGESTHLSHEERVTLIITARTALNAVGLESMPIIAGTGAGSTRETIELCRQAGKAGADYAMVIISGYFAGALAGNRKALKDFWVDVSENSPIPILIYNYPAASGGIDLDSDLIVELAITCPNICGVKLTCGDVGKLSRIANAVSNPNFLATYPRKLPDTEFLVLSGWTETLVPSAFVNGHGAITGLANLAPYSVVKLWDLANTAQKRPSLLPVALRLQGILGRADSTIAKWGIAGTKFLLKKKIGFGGLPRRPLLGMEPEAAEALWAHPHVKALFDFEQMELDL